MAGASGLVGRHGRDDPAILTFAAVRRPAGSTTVMW
jgi:hypothetical protein